MLWLLLYSPYVASMSFGLPRNIDGSSCVQNRSGVLQGGPDKGCLCELSPGMHHNPDLAKALDEGTVLR